MGTGWHARRWKLKSTEQQIVEKAWMLKRYLGIFEIQFSRHHQPPSDLFSSLCDRSCCLHYKDLPTFLWPWAMVGWTGPCCWVGLRGCRPWRRLLATWRMSSGWGTAVSLQLYLFQSYGNTYSACNCWASTLLHLETCAVETCFWTLEAYLLALKKYREVEH